MRTYFDCIYRDGQRDGFVISWILPLEEFGQNEARHSEYCLLDEMAHWASYPIWQTKETGRNLSSTIIWEQAAWSASRPKRIEIWRGRTYFLSVDCLICKSNFNPASVVVFGVSTVAKSPYRRSSSVSMNDCNLYHPWYD